MARITFTVDTITVEACGVCRCDSDGLSCNYYGEYAARVSLVLTLLGDREAPENG